MLKKLFVLSLFISHFSNAQKLEIGLGLGPTFYKGDIQPTFRVFNPRAASNVFVRYNYNRVISFKANGMIGFVGGNDSKSGNTLNKARDYSFLNTLLDYNAQIEYNFLNFRTDNGRYESNWTPYLFGGFGSTQNIKRKFVSHTTTVSQAKNSPSQILPFGIGIKKIYNGRWNVGVEFGTRVLLDRKNTDVFDGFGYKENEKFSYYLDTDANSRPKELTFPNTLQKDKYFHLSFSVSYLFYKVHCPPRF